MELTLLLTLITLFRSELHLTLMKMMLLQTLQELCKAKEKLKERKKWLWQLLLQRNAMQLIHISQLLWYPPIL